MASNDTEAPAGGAPPPPDSASTDRRPRIGLTTYWQRGEWGVWDEQAAIVPHTYVRAVVAAGGTPMLLPPHGTDADVLNVLDGLILIGGVDVDPSRYAQEPHSRTGPQPELDSHDTALLQSALDTALPVFAICRGAQVLNVALGGTLHQHMPELGAHASAHQPRPGVFGRMEFSTVRGSTIAGLLGERAWAPCYHHQCIDRLADPLEVTAYADDGTIEAVEMPEAAGWVLGTQFHPEQNLEDLRLFTGFLAAARESSGVTRGHRPRPSSPTKEPA